MKTEHNCPGCGKRLPPQAAAGLCPECLIKAGFGTGAAPGPGQPSNSSGFTPLEVSELQELFPQYEILALLGHGGMGAVYKARQHSLDRLVALKILPPHTAADAGFAERFTREARALARLSHPNIVAVYDFGEARPAPTAPMATGSEAAAQPGPAANSSLASSLHYLVMEYVDGASLRQLEQAGKLSPREALRIIPQICDALQFAHDEGIVHRDIKPENVMLDRRGRVKITDFGLAKILGWEPAAPRLTGAQDVMGTPHYMAPEQMEHPQQVDHRADIYSLGVVFYELLTGELPVGRFQPPSKKVEVDVRLDEVVLHALEKEPERRYQQARQVKTDVETIAAHPGETVSAPRQASASAANGRSEALQQVKAPGLGLALAGIFNLGVLALLGIVSTIGSSFSSGPEFPAPGAKYALLVVPGAAVLFIFVVIIVGGLQMRRLRNYRLALTASILGMIFGGLGLPFGVWSLVVLTRKEVRAAFAEAEADSGRGAPARGLAKTPAPKTRGAWVWIGVTAAAIAIILVLGILAATALTGVLALKLTSSIRQTPRLVSAVAFGPVIERTVYGPEHGNDCLIDFRSGTLLSLPRGLGPLTNEEIRLQALAWAQDHGADAAGAEAGNDLLSATSPGGGGAGPCAGLAGLRLSATPAENDAWVLMTAAELQNRSIGPLPNMISAGTFPCTFLFVSRKRDVGILQVLGTTNSGEAVRIRYKLLRPQES